VTTIAFATSFPEVVIFFVVIMSIIRSEIPDCYKELIQGAVLESAISVQVDDENDLQYKDVMELVEKMLQKIKLRSTLEPICGSVFWGRDLRREHFLDFESVLTRKQFLSRLIIETDKGFFLHFEIVLKSM
jgi:hypothetical protein